jgi:hypothetical protein
MRVSVRCVGLRISIVGNNFQNSFPEYAGLSGHVNVCATTTQKTGVQAQTLGNFPLRQRAGTRL